MLNEVKNKNFHFQTSQNVAICLQTPPKPRGHSEEITTIFAIFCSNETQLPLCLQSALRFISIPEAILCQRSQTKLFQRSVSFTDTRVIRNLIRSFLKGKKSKLFPCVPFDSVIIRFHVTTGELPCDRELIHWVPN
ncbi:hypothetical protein CEXT_256481 [Caerostris extrusa]|uniref:Uncharacterized protein n=1 Tax=Caerostris extrusa TaxID=172846 RepID=A0AAV4W850_CAEEX|nr:hypothetical protein CEXT_256481 [Caerostris extrusa]